MSVFKHEKGYYGYNFMHKGKRYCRTFKGLSKEEVSQLEIVHKSELIKNGYDITQKKSYFLSDLIKDHKEYTLAHYARPDEFDYVVDTFYKLTGDKNANDITVSDFEKYINTRLGSVKNSSINREMDVIKRIFSLAVQNKKISTNPCADLEKLRIENPPERFLTKEEEAKLLAVCNPMMKAIIITAIHTGMRQNELISLKWGDVFFDKGYLIALNTKNNKRRKITMTKTLKLELKSIPKLSEYVFTSPATKTRYTEVKKSFARAVERSGIDHISFHKLRHTTASRLYELGVDIKTIQKILDHADIKTTMGYIHSTKDYISEAINKLDEY